MVLADEGVLQEDGLIVADERLGLLAVHADPALVRDLATARLAPLAAATPASRERLEATLLSWLAHQGAVSEVAAALHVHPQTVRYRLARLRDHFGADLDDPDTRFELELALRARAPVAGARVA
jgi:DNA-binding PucR family transcriptional regulator